MQNYFRRDWIVIDIPPSKTQTFHTYIYPSLLPPKKKRGKAVIVALELSSTFSFTEIKRGESYLALTYFGARVLKEG